MSQTTAETSTLSPEKRELLERLRQKREGGELKTYPLSFAQERLWFLDRLEPDSPFYNLPMIFRVEGPLDGGVLRRTLAEIVRRHQALRTRFASLRGRPVQVIESRQQLESPTVDLSALAEREAKVEFDRRARRETRRPFDLARGPLLRLSLFYFGPERHGLVFNLHHIAGDGWSLGILMKEVKAIYEAFAAGRPSPLDELPIQYPDFAVWQRKWLEGEGLESQLEYWRERLEGAPPLLELPTDRPRPPMQTYRGSAVMRSFSPEVSRRLAERAREEKTTVFALLLAGFDLLLSRLTGRDDVIVGTAVAGRSRKETEPLIGFFVNTLVLRTDLSGASSFRQLIERVKRVVLGAYAHQDMPFERLVEALQPERALAYSPLFQVMLVLDNTRAEGTLEISGLEFKKTGSGTGTAQFDLNLYVSESGGRTTVTWHYNRDLFDRTTVARFAEHYRYLLGAAVEDPGAALEAVPVWGPAERQQVLREWNDTGAELPPEATVHALIEAQAERSPGATALVFGDESLSYEDLGRETGRLARHLAASGVGCGSVVGLYLERSLEAVVAMLAVLKAGGAYLPLDPSYPPERLAFMAEDAGAALLVTRGGRGEELAAGGAKIVDLDRDAEAIAARAAAAPDAGIGREDLAYVIYTSGSTGKPKGVMVPHGAVVNFFAGMDRHLGASRPGTWLAVTSISFDISVLELLYTLSRGYRTVIQSERPAGMPARASSSPAKTMEFSLFYFAADTSADDDPYRLLLEGARFADRHGFAAVWTPERHFHAFGGLYPNPSVTSAALAAVTERIQIRAGSVVLPLHHPVRVAEEWALVDNLSKGRVAISFASGWHADDFVFAPDTYDERKQVMFREIETVRELWRGGSVELPGGAGAPVEVEIHPRPVQAELPFWVTAGGSPETFRTAGEIGANLLTHLLGQSVDDLAKKIAIYRRAYREADHGPGEGSVTLMLHTYVGDDLDEVRALTRGPFTDYLRTAGGLIANLARSVGRSGEVDELSEEELEALLDHAFERYFRTSGLMGTLETCSATVDRLRAIGVDEIGCLIDFGIDAERTLAALEKLDELRRQVNDPERVSSSAPEPAGVSGQALPADLLERWQVTHLQCTPSMATLLAADPATAAGLASLDTWLLGGEALPAPLAQHLRGLTDAELLNVYGPTETTVWSATARVAGDDSPITIGRPIANTQIYLLDRDLRPVPVGVPGQLWIGGAGVVRGYLGRPGATAEKFVPDPHGAAGDRFYATGDLARRRADGELEFLGRLDHQVKIRGYRIEPGEIEAVLREHPDLRDAAVLSHRARGGEPQLVAWVVPENAELLAPRPAVDAAQRARLLDARPSFTLPNGMTVTHYDSRQADDLYREVFAEPVYLRHGMSYSDGDTIFDVGANAGFFTLFASQVCRPEKIYAFEPIPSNCELLRTNAALYDCPVEIYPHGVADAPGTAEFIFYPHHSGLSGRVFDLDRDLQELRTFARHGLDSALGESSAALAEEEIEGALEEHLRGEKVECRLVTLSEVIREHGIERIDMLKVDVEKSEVHVLEGLAEEDWPKVRQVMLEVHGQELLDRTREILEGRGFELAIDEELALEADDDGADLYNYMVYARRPEDGSLAERRSLAPPSAASLRGYLRESLPDYMVPAVFVPIAELPLTPNGKLDRKALPEPEVSQRSAAARYVAPRTETERRLAEIWQKLLRVEKIGLEDNFFEIGGTSLLLVQAHQRMRRELEVEISLVEMFRHPTVGSMAAYLGGERKAPDAVEQSRKRVKKQTEAASSSEALDRQRQFLEKRRQRRRRG